MPVSINFGGIIRIIMNKSSQTSLSSAQKRVIASTATGFSFENMDLISCLSPFLQSLPV